MSVSESLRKQAYRAKIAEDHANAAASQARGDLEKTVDDVRASAEAQAIKVQADAQKASSEPYRKRRATSRSRGGPTSTR